MLYISIFLFVVILLALYFILKFRKKIYKLEEKIDILNSEKAEGNIRIPCRNGEVVVLKGLPSGYNISGYTAGYSQIGRIDINLGQLELRIFPIHSKYQIVRKEEKLTQREVNNTTHISISKDMDLLKIDTPQGWLKYSEEFGLSFT